jgi:hypothetical protein
MTAGFAASVLASTPETIAQSTAVPPASSPDAVASPDPAAGWKFGGDFRLRYERTERQQPTDDPLVRDPRRRAVLRFRAGVTRDFGRHLTFGARLATGSADDPNSTDVTIGDFADRFEVSLDRAFVELREGGFVFTGGKFANPFTTTELVWDGDVQPQGIAGSYGRASGRVKPRVVGLLYVVDEQGAGPDSSMAGAQAQISVSGASAWSLALSGGYYDYTIESLRGADAGDTRSNRLTADGLRYLSDFDLLDWTLHFDHPGFGRRYPVKLVGDYVKNLGADDQNDGFGFDLFVGRAAARGDTRFRYGYAQAGTDAVLAAFSHDNTSLATNYRQHTASFEWQLRDELQLSATWYLYRQLEAGAVPNPWISRLRLNALVTF